MNKKKLLTLISNGLFGPLSPLVILFVARLSDDQIGEMFSLLVRMLTILERDPEGHEVLVQLGFYKSSFATLLHHEQVQN